MQSSTVVVVRTMTFLLVQRRVPYPAAVIVPTSLLVSCGHVFCFLPSRP